MSKKKVEHTLFDGDRLIKKNVNIKAENLKSVNIKKKSPKGKSDNEN